MWKQRKVEKLPFPLRCNEVKWVLDVGASICSSLGGSWVSLVKEPFLLPNWKDDGEVSLCSSMWPLHLQEAIKYL